ncbi:MAG: pyridoxal-phosphate dependent enzyme [Gammaproteobacteria bacterium]|nr:pyridoxal-phosphate dependent enzyme [Gammaproteobacteria bacterium]
MNNHSLRVYESILGLLCNADNPTPLVRLTRVVPFRHTQVYAKLEWFNPFGSVKDRVAFNMVGDAEERGVIGTGQKLVEPTSGNTGLGLVMVANKKGYSLTTPLSNEIPPEKRTMLRFFGANVLELEDTLCPAPGAPEGAVARAMEIAEQPEFHMLNQYANVANPEAHYRTTGPEIWRQTQGKVTHLVAGLGTCGTITGTGQFLKEQNPDVQVLGVHPNEGHDIPGVRSIRQLQQTRFFRPEQYDGLVEVRNNEAFDLCLRLNREESITAGPSSAMALEGAFKLIPDEPGNRVVVIFPDSAFKYASSVVKHLAGLGAAQATPASGQEGLLEQMVENVRANATLTIDVESAHEVWQRHNPFVMDVCDYAKYCEGHIPGAVNMPLQDLDEHIVDLPENLDTPVLSVCQRGNMSLLGVLFLTTLGYRNVRSVIGGTIAWREKGFITESTGRGLT